MSFEQEKMIVGSLPSLYPLQKFEEEAINALVSLPIDDDAISRKAAIEAVEFGITYAKAINKETGEVTALFEESNAELREAADRIKKLPSALTEHIIHCKDCKYFKQVFAPNDNDGLCGHWHSKCDARTNRNGYCSHAERKQNDTERC